MTISNLKVKPKHPQTIIHPTASTGHDPSTDLYKKEKTNALPFVFFLSQTGAGNCLDWIETTIRLNSARKPVLKQKHEGGQGAGQTEVIHGVESKRRLEVGENQQLDVVLHKHLLREAGCGKDAHGEEGVHATGLANLPCLLAEEVN